jgi:hypothetical protein
MFLLIAYSILAFRQDFQQPPLVIPFKDASFHCKYFAVAKKPDKKRG